MILAMITWVQSNHTSSVGLFYLMFQLARQLWKVCWYQATCNHSKAVIHQRANLLVNSKNQTLYKKVSGESIKWLLYAINLIYKLFDRNADLRSRVKKPVFGIPPSKIGITEYCLFYSDRCRWPEVFIRFHRKCQSAISQDLSAPKCQRKSNPTKNSVTTGSF